MQRNLKVKSPDGRIIIRFQLKDMMLDMGMGADRAVYSIGLDGQDLLKDSRLGLVLRDDRPLNGPFVIRAFKHRSKDSSWRPVYGERSVIPDCYNELVIDLKETSGRFRHVRLEFRAYNEGAAFRYVLPEQQGLSSFSILTEYSHFAFPDGCMAYEEHGTEGEYVLKPISDIKPECERPLTVSYTCGAWLSLTEAGLNDYSRMLLSVQRGRRNILFSELSGPVEGRTPFVTPWRVFIIGDTPGALVENNYLVLNLNEPCALQDTGWIKPGKAVRVMGLSMDAGIRCADFAVQLGLQYIEFDAGWYGHEYDHDADAGFASVDPDRRNFLSASHPGLDLSRVIAYAGERGIGVILYVNRRALEQQLDELLPIYRSWGVAGLKFGFVRVGPQVWTTWLLAAVRKCAAYGMVVDIHDNYRPTGYSRTYPNLLTQEGIRGNEHHPTPRHNCTLPFTRYPAGAGDYTICYYDHRSQTTHAHQLALAVICYSPLQFLFWYDDPDQYQGEAENEFFTHVPTVWDETRVMDGAVGEFAIFARRKGNEWFVGCITNEEPRDLNLAMHFLPAGEGYTAFRYADDFSASASRTNVSREVVPVRCGSVLRISMSAGGGHAIRLVPGAVIE